MIEILQAMPSERFAAFMVGALVVNLAPGQDMVFATACGVQGGPRVGALAGLGAGTGVLWHITLAALGVSALIAAHPEALDAIRWVGAAYLLYLAVSAWRAGGTLVPGRGVPSGRRAFLRGILSNVLNPKPVLFILAFLPQFVDPAMGPVWKQVVALGLVFAFSGTLVTMGYGAIAGYAGQALAARMGVVNKLAAVLFFGLALRLATE
ncbi:MAG: LysE family translocator [Paracoccaceae bacterium]|nr:LysE family translocator [Paracoccaceae bacterium]